MARKQAVAEAAPVDDEARLDEERLEGQAEAEDEDTLTASGSDEDEVEVADDDDADDGDEGLNTADTATSQTAKESMRQQLAADVEAFLAAGGQIEEVPHDYRADPPKKPENNYGRGSI